MRESITIDGCEVAPGSRVSIDVSVSRRYTANPVAVPVHVIHGRLAGPCLLVCAAVHGDEINGVEIVRRLLGTKGMSRLRGTLIAVPIVNVYGFVAQSRYLPDRRDLNRSFPGSSRGSLAARLAHTMMTKLAAHATHVIDLHTGALHRDNLPQIRACLDEPDVEAMAKAFEVPVILHSALRDGSLRAALRDKGTPAIVYEAGEALRFDEIAIRAGVRGVRGVMRSLAMLPPSPSARPMRAAVIAAGSQWVRAPESGIVLSNVRLGESVAAGDRLASISDPLGRQQEPVLAPEAGVVIGRTNLPLVNEGDALFHVARVARPGAVASRVEAFQETLDPDSDDELERLEAGD